MTKSLNRRLTAITKQRGSAPLTPAGACGPWTPLSLRQSGAPPPNPKPPKLPILIISQNLATGHLRFTLTPWLSLVTLVPAMFTPAWPLYLQCLPLPGPCPCNVYSCLALVPAMFTPAWPLYLQCLPLPFSQKTGSDLSD